MDDINLHQLKKLFLLKPNLITDMEKIKQQHPDAKFLEEIKYGMFFFIYSYFFFAKKILVYENAIKFNDLEYGIPSLFGEKITYLKIFVGAFSCNFTVPTPLNVNIYILSKSEF